TITAGGNVSFSGDINTAAPINGTFGASSGFINGGAVSITAGGTVGIGTGTPGSADNPSVMTHGADYLTGVTSAGNGGAITITAAAISLPNGINSRGGEAGAGSFSLTGTDGSGGNAGNISLTATGAGAAGGIVVGAPVQTVDYSSTALSFGAIVARGGRAFG